MILTRPGLACATALLLGSATLAHAEPPPGPPPNDAAAVGPPPGAAGGPRSRGGPRPAGYQARKFNGGQGASWKTGRGAYGFQGAYGGCQYRGHAGPHGYRVDKVC